jgi:Glyoxalase-like domain
LTSREGGAERRPRLHFDHVQVAVPDLERAADEYQRQYGLLALPGGRHPGRGTANMIVPLGGSYLELIAVVDPVEAEALPTSMRVARAVESGRTFATWAARTADLDATRLHLEDLGFDLAEPLQGARRRPDGVELAWRMQELVPGAEFSPLPFLIQWQVPGELFPGAAIVAHPCGARAVASLRLSDVDPGAASARLSAVLDDDVDFTVEQGPPGLIEVVLDARTGPVLLR